MGAARGQPSPAVPPRRLLPEADAPEAEDGSLPGPAPPSRTTGQRSPLRLRARPPCKEVMMMGDCSWAAHASTCLMTVPSSHHYQCLCPCQVELHAVCHVGGGHQVILSRPPRSTQLRPYAPFPGAAELGLAPAWKPPAVPPRSPLLTQRYRTMPYEELHTATGGFAPHNLLVRAHSRVTYI